MMSTSPGGWNSLKVTGQAPPPCSSFTLTTIGEKRAAMYGGSDGSNKFNHLFIVELGRYSVVSMFTTCIQNYQKSAHKINWGSLMLTPHLSNSVPCDLCIYLSIYVSYIIP